MNFLNTAQWVFTVAKDKPSVRSVTYCDVARFLLVSAILHQYSSIVQVSNEKSALHFLGYWYVNLKAGFLGNTNRKTVAVLQGKYHISPTLFFIFFSFQKSIHKDLAKQKNYLLVILICKIGEGHHVEKADRNSSILLSTFHHKCGKKQKKASFGYCDWIAFLSESKPVKFGLFHWRRKWHKTRHFYWKKIQQEYCKLVFCRLV